MKSTIKTRNVVLPVLVCSMAACAQAADFQLDEGTLSVNGNVSIGQAVRTVKQNPKLLPNANSSKVGVTGEAVTAYSGRNQDDGNLNFDRGDAVSQVLKAYLSLGYKWHDYGAVVSAKAWYDYALANADHPYGNLPNGYERDSPLSDSGAKPLSQFKGLVLDNAYVYGHELLGATPVDWKLGYQKLNWGNHFLALGGLSDLTPIDYSALVRPGVVLNDETRIAIPLAFTRVGLTQDTSLEAFYQFAFEPNAANECGTFYSQLDFVSQGCNGAMFGAKFDDQSALASGNYVGRAKTQYPSNGGQGGIALKHMVEPLHTEFGVYAAQFDSRMAFYGAVKSQQPGANPFVVSNPALNPEYFTRYPEKIRMFSATFDTQLKNGSVYGELTYRPNQPVQYNAIDLLSAFVSNTAPTPLRDAANAVPAGGEFSGYKRMKAVQGELGTTLRLAPLLGSPEPTLGGDVIYKLLPDMPSASEGRFGRSDVFGQGPVNGVCPAPGTSSQCSSDGYVSRTAYGYRLRAGLKYPNAIGNITLAPSLLFGQDVSGWAGDGSIVEGRKLAIASMKADFRNGWVAEIAWQPTWGGTYNNQRDRSTALADIAFKF